jgi:hypothetical protein
MKVLICFEKFLTRLLRGEVEGEEISVSKLSSDDDFHEAFFKQKCLSSVLKMFEVYFSAD